MKLLELIKIEKYNRYIFLNLDDNTKIDLVLEFHEAQKILPLLIKDSILINEELLNKKSPNYVEPYAFELTTDTSLKQVLKTNSKENLVLVRDDKNYIFKRIYG